MTEVTLNEWHQHFVLSVYANLIQTVLIACICKPNGVCSFFKTSVCIFFTHNAFLLHLCGRVLMDVQIFFIFVFFKFEYIL